MDIKELIDDQGYPTGLALRTIAGWMGDYTELMKLIKPIWNYSLAGYWSEEENQEGRTEYYISTGGWSGNEELLRAMKNNSMFWSLCWVQSRRGGHYIFEVR